MIYVIILRNNNNYDILKPSLNIDFFSWLLEVIMKFDTYFCCDDIEELFDGDFEFFDFLEENFDNKATLSEKDFELFFDKLHQ